MAANKFATMLHKNCHKIIVILVYTVLEWILILLLLLNSSFSYLIRRFAGFFGLKPSCTWCSRLDNVFDSSNSHCDHVCDAHGAEIAKLSYCTSHKRLAESRNLCNRCSPSPSVDYGTINDISTVALFAWMSENGEEKRCCCCGEIMSTKACPPPLIFKPSCDVLDYLHKKASLSQPDLVKHEIELQEKGDDELHSDGGQEAQGPLCGPSRREKLDSFEVQEWNSSQNDDPFWNLGSNEDDESVFLADMLLQNADYTDSDRFICIELIDSVSSNQPLTNCSDTERSTRAMEEHEDQQGDAGVEKEDDDEEAVDFPDFDIIGGTIHSFSKNQVDEEADEGRLQEGSVGADSLDGNVVREIEDGEYVKRENVKMMIEECVKALYAEMEEERKAAEEAAKETMAMITKLQEEKAAVQIEALQYQRMMEEQAEYDQEALQLLNDLMIKREKEKKELEKELEVYRNRVLDYETTAMIRTRNEGLMRTTSSDNDDDLSVDLEEYDDTPFGSHQEHNLDYSLEEECIKNMNIPDVSIAEFDEERVSILEQVKILEAKLLALHEDDRSADHERETTDLMGKKLLPLLDATENVNQLEDSKMMIQDELGHVYERLQALEEDKDFLKHCIRSVMKGNKGLTLLQEILQHLRDLKSVDLSATNMPLSESDVSMIKEDQV